MTLSRRSLLQTGIIGGIGLSSLTGCQATNAITGVFSSPAAPMAIASDTKMDVVSHALMRLTYGIHPDDRARVINLSHDQHDAVQQWIEQQLQPHGIDDQSCERLIRRFEALAQPLGELYEFKERVLLRELTTATTLRAVYSNRQLHERLVGFWHDHFNVDMSKGECAWVTVAYDRDVIRAHALNKFSDLLRSVVLSPAMLWYLDGRVNRVSNVGMKPNENYARELLELHTLGVDGGYSQNDVMEVARCLSGWTVRNKKRFKKGTIEFHHSDHDDGEKTVLGTTIPAGGGQRDLDMVLDLVAHHPSTARHIARKLCQHFIHDHPDAAVIQSVEKAFIASDGDIATTMRALTASSAFINPVNFAAKLKRPFHYIASCLRTTAAASDGGYAIYDYLQRLGHLPFQFPTPDGQPDHIDAWSGSLLWRWRFAAALTNKKLRGTTLNHRELLQRCGSQTGVIAHILGRKPTPDEVTFITKDPQQALGLLLASPHFQYC